MRSWPLLPALLCAACAAGSRDLLGAAARPGLSAIRGEAIAASARFLSDDLLEGRGTGTRGHAIAARHVAQAFEALGLVPVGDRGTYMQSVPLAGAALDVDGTTVTVTGAGGAPEPLRLDEEVVVIPSLLAEQVRVVGRLVFVGFGVTEAELAADVEGKIAVVLWGAPATGPGGQPMSATERALASDRVAKARLLAERGAFAVLIVSTPDSEAVIAWPDIVAGNRFERIDWIDAGGPATHPPVPVAWIRSSVLERLLPPGRPFRTIWDEAKQARLAPFALDARASLVVRSRHRKLVSENVVGLLRGSDPARAGEVLVYSAHLDHLGIGEPRGEDAIYNGALDNAVGVAAIMEIARGFAALPTPPPRSLLFLAVTAEESGLVGSHYFVRHPSVPIASIVANINIDLTTPLFEPFEVVARGMEHSTLERNVRAAAAAAGVVVADDPVPEQVLFIRSDQYRFVQAGVPAIYPGTGLGDASGRKDANAARVRAWYAEQYHLPSDEWSGAFLPAWLEKEARLHFLIGLSVASDDERPRWRPESPFAR